MLGAVLFLTYVHDTPACIRYKFADDLVTTAVDKDIRQIEYVLQKSLIGQHGPVVEKVGYTRLFATKGFKGRYRVIDRVK